MSEWQECNLSEVYEFASGLSKPRSEFGSGYPFLSFKDVFYNYFVPSKLESLVRTNAKERQRCSVRRGDVFLTRTSETMDELGMSCVALQDIPDATFNGFTKRLRPKRDGVVLPEYAGYFFRSCAFRAGILSLTTMSTRASLNNEMLGRLQIKFPPVSEQSAIGSMLLNLDRKIELNRRMNETLEAMARAIFTDWFVDFGPTRAKIEGRDRYLASEIWNLFPDALDEEEKPEGWRQGKLNEIVSQRTERIKVGSETLAKPYVPIDCISPKSLFLSNSKPGSKAKSSLTSFHEGDILFGAMRPYFHKVCIAPFDGTTRTTVFVLRPNRSEDFGFATMVLHHPETIDFATNHSTGSTIPYASWKNSLENMPVVIPPTNLRGMFETAVRSLLDAIPKAYFANESLAQTRDLLLPKLMSGEIRLRDAEKAVEAVA